MEKMIEHLLEKAAKAVDTYLDKVDNCSTKEEEQKLERELKQKLGKLPWKHIHI